MKKTSSQFFLSQRSKRGVLIFLVISLSVVFIPRIWLALTPKEDFVISSEDIKELKEEQFSREKRFALKSFKKKGARFRSPEGKFDPNQYSAEDWMKLGLSRKQSAVVLKFTERGIYSNEQLQKIFVIPSELYEMIKDSTFYPAREFKKDENKPAFVSKKEIVLIDVNSADQEEMETIPGVGPFYAKNIIKYRDRLGGFSKKEQLLEVWKMDVEKYTSIEKYIKINPTSIQQLHLNTVKVEQLKTHPYLNWNSANSIIKMRDMKGGFKKIDEIKESVLIDEELFEKIKPYLSL